MGTINLQVLDLYILDGRIRYQKALNEINSDDPYYSTELLFIDWKPGKHLRCFVYVENYIPKVLMPFYLMPIESKNTSLPYFDASSPWGHNGPLVNPSEDTIILKEFWKMVDEWYKENHVVTEFVRFGFNGNHNYYSGVIEHTLQCIQGKILPEDEQFSTFKPKVRNNYRKALKNKLECKIYASTITAPIIEDFYDIYIATMRRLKAEQSYFISETFFNSFIAKNPQHCAIALVYFNGIPISTELILLSKDTLHSFLGGTNASYFDKRPNDFLKIKVLEWARKNGYHYYFLGGGKQNDDSLHHYKKSFFPHDREVQFLTGRKIINPEIYNELLVENSINKSLLTPEQLKTENSYFPEYRASKDLQ